MYQSPKDIKITQEMYQSTSDVKLSQQKMVPNLLQIITEVKNYALDQNSKQHTADSR